LCLFSLLKDLDEGIKGNYTDNASFTHIEKLEGLCDDWLFNEICKEYNDYPATARRLKMLPAE